MKLLINENPLQVLPSLAARIGLNEAMFLQQLHYWLNTSTSVHDGRRWVFNSALEWRRQFPFWSEATIRRVISSLKKQRLIVTTSKYNKKRYDKTTWFAIDYEQLEQLEVNPTEKATGQNDQSVTKPTSQNDHMHVVKMTRPIPETTRDKTLPPKKPAAPARPKKTTDPRHGWFVKWWHYAYEVRTGQPYAMTKADAGRIKQLLAVLGLTDLVCRACSYLMLPEGRRFPRGAPVLAGLQQMINQVADLDREAETQFINAGVLPDLEQDDIDLIDFTPWSRDHEPTRRTA